MNIERKVYHVTHCKAGWATTLENTVFPIRISKVKATAIKFACSLAKSRRHIGQVIIHGRDGQIQREFTYGIDSPKSKG
jgi:hypothetical protein